MKCVHSRNRSVWNLTTQPKPLVLSKMAFDLAFAHAHACPCYSMKIMLSGISEGSSQAKPPGSVNTHPSLSSGCPGRDSWPLKCTCATLSCTSRLQPSTHPGFPPWSTRQQRSPTLIISDVWLATVFVRLCPYSVLGWPHPLGDKKMCAFESKDLKMQSRSLLWSLNVL
jgi:hypothetical protein